MTGEELRSPHQLREWLQRKHIVLLDKFLQELPTVDRWTMVLQTVNLTRHMIGSTPWHNAAEVLNLLRGLGRELSTVTREPAVSNMIRRVMSAVREEAQREAREADGVADESRVSLQSMLWALPQHVKVSRRHVVPSPNTIHQRQESLASEADVQDFPVSYYTARPTLKQSILEAIQEILTDLEDMHKNINEQVDIHLHAGEVILTCGKSKTVEEFLKASKHKVTVIVCGNREMAESLKDAVESIMYVEYAAAFSIMARVHKVLLPAHAVLANGGVVSTAGTNLVALAAHRQAVPTVCVTGIYKLCPLYPNEGQDTLQECVRPTTIVMNDVEQVQPVYDTIDPQLISLYITNVGSFPPSFIYRLLAENYHSDDWK